MITSYTPGADLDFWKGRGTARFVITVDVGLAWIYGLSYKHVNVRGLVAVPQEILKNYTLRLNLRAFLVIYHA